MRKEAYEILKCKGEGESHRAHQWKRYHYLIVFVVVCGMMLIGALHMATPDEAEAADTTGVSADHPWGYETGTEDIDDGGLTASSALYGLDLGTEDVSTAAYSDSYGADPSNRIVSMKLYRCYLEEEQSGDGWEDDNCPDGDGDDPEWYAYFSVTADGSWSWTRSPISGDWGLSRDLVHGGMTYIVDEYYHKGIGAGNQAIVAIALLDDDTNGKDDELVDISGRYGEGGTPGDDKLPTTLSSTWRGAVFRFKYDLVKDTIVSPEFGDANYDEFHYPWSDYPGYWKWPGWEDFIWTEGARDYTHPSLYDTFLLLDIWDDYERPELTWDTAKPSPENYEFNPKDASGSPNPKIGVIGSPNASSVDRDGDWILDKSTTFRLKNTGGDTATVNVYLDSASGDFTLEGGGGTGISVSAGGTHDITVKFIPLSEGEHTATLTVECYGTCTWDDWNPLDDYGNYYKSRTFTLKGYGTHCRGFDVKINGQTGVASSWPKWGDALHYHFGTVKSGSTSKPMTFTVTNHGSDNPIGSVQLTDPVNMGEFNIIDTVGIEGQFSVKYEGGEHTSETFTVTFTPTTPGRYTNTIKLDSDNPSKPDILINLIGDCPGIEVPNDHHFGGANADDNEHVDWTFNLNAIGGGNATGMVFLASEQESQENFTITGGGGAFNISAGLSKTITVRFHPTGGYNVTGHLRIIGDNVDNKTITLNGTGTRYPTAVIKGPAYWNPDIVEFNAGLSHDNDEPSPLGNHIIVQYEWCLLAYSEYSYSWYSIGEYTYTEPRFCPFFPESFSPPGANDPSEIIECPYNVTVELMVTDDEGETAACYHEMTIREGPVPPYANAGSDGISTAYEYTAIMNRTVHFDASKSCDGDKNGSEPNITAYWWKFFEGDTWHIYNYSGYTDPATAASHVYSEEGIYNATLMVIDNENETDSTTAKVCIKGPENPTAVIECIDFSMVNQAVIFNGSGSYDNDEHWLNPGGGYKGYKIDTWEWDFESDGTIDATGSAMSHIYTEEGMYTVTLIVTDNDNQTGIATAEIEIQGYKLPTAVIPYGYYGAVMNRNITLDGRLSHDNDEKNVKPPQKWPHEWGIERYDWNFDDGTGWHNDIEAVVNISYNSLGLREVTLRVWDNEDKTDTTTAKIYISPFQDPTAFFAPPYVGTEYVTQTFDATESKDNDEMGLSVDVYTWDFGDGNVTRVPRNLGGFYYDKSYWWDGTYTVSLTVEDNDFATNTFTQEVVIANNPPTAVIRATRLGDPRYFKFDATDSIDHHPYRDYTDLYYRWDFNNDGHWDKAGYYDVASVVEYRFGTTGRQIVRLQVESDKDGTGNAIAHVVSYASGDFSVTQTNEGFFLSYLDSGLPNLDNRYCLTTPSSLFDRVTFQGGGLPITDDTPVGSSSDTWSGVLAVSDMHPGDYIVIKGYYDGVEYYHAELSHWGDVITPHILETPDWFVEFLTYGCSVDVDTESDYSKWEMTVTPVTYGLQFSIPEDTGPATKGSWGFSASVSTPDEFTIDNSESVSSSERIIETLIEGSFTVDYTAADGDKSAGFGFSPHADLVIDDTAVSLEGALTLDVHGSVSKDIPLTGAFCPTFLAAAGATGGIEIKIYVTHRVCSIDEGGFSNWEFRPLSPREYGVITTINLGVYAQVLMGLGRLEGGVEGEGHLKRDCVAEKTTLTITGSYYAKASALWGAISKKWTKPFYVNEYNLDVHAGYSATMADEGSIAPIVYGTDTSPECLITMQTLDIPALKSYGTGEVMPQHRSPWTLAENVAETATPKIVLLDDGTGMATWTDIHQHEDVVMNITWAETDVWWSMYDGSNWSAPQHTDTRSVCEFNPELAVIQDVYGEEHVVLTYLQVNRTLFGGTDPALFFSRPMIQTAVWNASNGWSFSGNNVSFISGTVNAMALAGHADTVYLTYLTDSDSDPFVNGIRRIYCLKGQLNGGKILWETPTLLETVMYEYTLGDCNPVVSFVDEEAGGVFFTTWNNTLGVNELVFVATTSGIHDGAFDRYILQDSNKTLSHIHAETAGNNMTVTWVENYSRICQRVIEYHPSLYTWTFGDIEELYTGTAITYAKPVATAATNYIIFQHKNGSIPHVIEQLPGGSWGKCRSVSIEDIYSPGQVDADATDSYRQMIYLCDTSIEKWLIGHWQCNEGEGSNAEDVSGNGNNGTLVNNPQWKAHADETGALNPVYGHYLKFAGANQYVEVIDNTSLDVTEEFTLCSWVNLSDDSASPVTIIAKDDSWALLEEHGNLIVKLWRDDGIVERSDIVSLPLNTWTFISVIYNHGRLNITIRPTGLDTTSVEYNLGDSNITGSTAPLQIGGFNGSIDEVWLFTRDISMSEVNSIWFTPYATLGSTHDVVVQALPSYASFNITIKGHNSSISTEDIIVCTGSPSEFEFWWKFSDGTNVSGDEVEHQFTTPGYYTIICNATDPDTHITTPLTKTIQVTDKTPPDFDGLKNAIADENAVNLTWDNATDTSSFVLYYIYMRRDGESFNFSSPSLVSLNTSYTVTGLTAGVTYDFIVRAVDAYGNIDNNSSNKSATPFDTTPPTFDGLESVYAISNIKGELILSWNPADDPSLPITYNIYMSTTSGVYDFSDPIGNTTMNYYIVENLSYQPYYFVVRAMDAWGNEDNNTVEHNTVPTLDVMPPTTTLVVGTPHYGPNDEWVTSHTSIAFNASDDILGVSTIWYRMWYNGTWTPWMQYTGAFTLWGECVHHIEYYSVDNGGNVEHVQNATLYVDDTPPVSWHTPEWIPMQHPNPSAVITIHAKDEGICSAGGYSILYGIWGTDIHGHVDNKSAVFSVPDIEGSYRLIYWVVDMLGNSEKHHRIDFRVMLENTVYKTLSFSGYHEWAETHWMITPDTGICFDPEAAEVVEIYWRIDSGNWSKYTECFTVPIGLHSIYCYGIDEGNRRQTVAHFLVEAVSTLAPTTTCTLSSFLPDGSNGWYTNDIAITLTAFDEISGVDSTYYKIDEDRWINYSASITVTEDGEHTFKYYSVDRAGNTEEEKSTMFKIDKTNPTVAFEQPAYGYLYLLGKEILPLRRTVIIGKTMVVVAAIDATSGISRVVFYVDDELKRDVSGEPFEWLWDEFVVGGHTLKVVAYDTAGNIATDEQEVWIFNLNVRDAQGNMFQDDDNLYRNLKADGMYGVPGFEAILLLGVIITAVILEKKRKPKR